jgi:O-succinylhomoserine sulfhydrylase
MHGMRGPTTSSAPSNWKVATKLIHGGVARSQYGELCEPLFLTQSYIFQSAEEAEARFLDCKGDYIYSRISNPTTSMFESRLAELEGAESAKSTASGMAAITTLLFGCLQAGDHVVAPNVLFGASRYLIKDLLPRFGITSTFIDGTDIDAWDRAIRPNTRMLFLETPANPTLEVYDVQEISRLSQKYGTLLVVDNAMASSIVQRPLDLGADCVIHSATKHIDGQGRCLGGAILGRKAFIESAIYDMHRQTGPTLSPFNAWILLKSLETMPMRVAGQQRSAQTLSAWLKVQPGVKRVLYPGDPSHPQYDIARRQMSGGGTLISFEVHGGKAEAFRFCNSLKLFSLSNNFGDAKSIVTHPATTTHQRFSAEEREEMGVPDSLLRLSIGLEDVDDLRDDLAGAFERMAHGEI